MLHESTVPRRTFVEHSTLLPRLPPEGSDAAVDDPATEPANPYVEHGLLEQIVSLLP